MRSLKRLLLVVCMACARVERSEEPTDFVTHPPMSEPTIIPESQPRIEVQLPVTCGEPPPGVDSNKELAKALFVNGQQSYHLGDFGVAAETFLRAYRTYPSYILLFNAAQSFRMAGHNAEAIAYYRQYLCYETNEELRIKTQQHIEALEGLPSGPPPPPPG
jgi:tetratricopeptide (TPR) repeat protein